MKPNKYFRYLWNYVKREEFFISIEHCLDFSIVFSAPLLAETCFQQAGSSAVEGSSQAVLESSEQRKVLASLTLYQKLSKICFTLEKDLSTSLSVIFDLFL